MKIMNIILRITHFDLMRIINIVLFIIVFLWFGASVLRLALNILSLPQEISKNVDDVNERYDYNNIQKLQSLNSNKIVIDTTDGRLFFLSRYSLYPKKIFLKSEKRYPSNTEEIVF